MDDHLQCVTQLERELLRTEVRRDRHRVRQLLHPEFREFGSSGTVWTAETIVEHLAIEGDAADDLRMEEPVAQTLGPGSVLVTYVARRGDRRSLRSSVWVLDGDTWLLFFHQGTHRP